YSLARPLYFYVALHRCAPPSTLFPYTTLFRFSAAGARAARLPTHRAAASLPRHRRSCLRSAAVRLAGERAPRGRTTSEPSRMTTDRKSTRLNSSHEWISYDVLCLKKKDYT